jgi:DNA-binding NtrC family response regulator
MFSRASEGTVIEHVTHAASRYLADDPTADAQPLIAEFAERFVTIGPSAVDDAIVECLRRVAGSLHLDRAVIWHNVPAMGIALPSHSWFAGNGSVPIPLPLATMPGLAASLRKGEATCFSRLDQVQHAADRETFQRQGFRSASVLPIRTAEGGAGLSAVAFASTFAEYEWTPPVIAQLRVFSAILGQALARKTTDHALKEALDELIGWRERATERASNRHCQPALESPATAVLRAARFRDQLATENLYLRKQVQELGTGTIIGQSEALRRVLEQVRQVAVTDSTVLLLGETGTGKELLATHLHDMSTRRGRVMVRVNCAAIPSTLIESELFGREKGAFTGALARQVGRFELADNSTIFLDEIGDLPADIQVKLLRVLEERQIERLGSPRPIRVNVRIIAATHRNLEQCVAQGTFREDLFYRLNVFPIQVPPLRERVDDIPLLVWRFVEEFSKTFGKRIDTISRENIAALQQYAWPGNIRELRNFVERAMIAATDHRLSISVPTLPGQPGKSVKMVEVEREHLRSILESSRWRIRGMGGAAERLGLKPTTLETRMSKLGLVRPKH